MRTDHVSDIINGLCNSEACAHLVVNTASVAAGLLIFAVISFVFGVFVMLMFD